VIVVTVVRWFVNKIIRLLIKLSSLTVIHSEMILYHYPINQVAFRHLLILKYIMLYGCVIMTY